MTDGSITAANSLIIRHAVSADAHQVISGINTICSEGGAFYTTRFVITPQWEAVLHHPEMAPDHNLVVAEWNGEVIGSGRLFPGGRYTLMNHTAELGLFVLKPFRRQGIGRRIMDYLANWAIQTGLEKITLTVLATNEPAIHFFKAYGFSEEGRMRRQVKIMDEYTDLLLMAHFLH